MAIVPTACCGFECGVNSATAHWALVSNSAFDTATVRNGARSLRINTTSAAGTSTTTAGLAANTVVVARFAIRFATSLPGADTQLAYFAGAVNLGVYFKNSDSKIYCGSATGSLGATGVTVTTGTWYYIDVKWDVHANPWTVDANVNGTALGQATSAQAASTISTITIGHSATVTADIYYDDWIVSVTSADYPIGDGKVLGQSPTDDGLHNVSGTNFVVGNAGPSLTVTSTDVWRTLDDVPLALNTSDFINQQTSQSGQFIEVFFGAGSASDAPRGIDFVMAGHKGTTAAANAKWKLYDNGVTDVAWQHGSATNTSGIEYNRKMYASMVGGGAWTQARAYGLYFHWGYSTDATPDVYADAAMLEWEFAATAVASGSVPITATGVRGSGLLSVSAPGLTLTIPFSAAL